MTTEDHQLLSLLRSHGLGPEKLFIAGEALYVSDDAGDFRADSTFERLPPQLQDLEFDLLSLARRLGLPEYASASEVSADISQFKDWEALYERLLHILESRGKHDPFGDGDYFLIDDYYCSTQHKVECTSASVVTPELIAEVQSALLGFPEVWEVIFAFPSHEGTDHALIVYKNRCEHSEA